MRKLPRRHIEYVGRTFDDPAYDLILREFSSDHPDHFESWRNIEKDLFEKRLGLCAYPDQKLMRYCQEKLHTKLIDYRGGLGSFHVWSVLRGRILRILLEEEPSLHPAPGKVLMTEPRTCTDRQLVEIVEDFKRGHPHLWDEWSRIEATDQFGGDPLRLVSTAFHRSVRDRCWVMSNTAITTAFSAVRQLYFLTPGAAELH